MKAQIQPTKVKLRDPEHPAVALRSGSTKPWLTRVPSSWWNEIFQRRVRHGKPPSVRGPWRTDDEHGPKADKDRPGPPQARSPPPMPVAVIVALVSLLHAGRRERREPCPDATDPSPGSGLCSTTARGDEQFLETPWYGARQMSRWLHRQGHVAGRHRVRRLMRSSRDRGPSGAA